MILGERLLRRVVLALLVLALGANPAYQGEADNRVPQTAPKGDPKVNDQPRDWTYEDGGRVVGVFLELKDDIVRIRKLDGETVSVPLKKLMSKDQAYAFGERLYTIHLQKDMGHKDIQVTRVIGGLIASGGQEERFVKTSIAFKWRVIRDMIKRPGTAPNEEPKILFTVGASREMTYVIGLHIKERGDIGALIDEIHKRFHLTLPLVLDFCDSPGRSDLYVEVAEGKKVQ